jgi:competence protein ComEC
LLITGFSPSIVRASLVSFLALSAWYFGRQFKPLLLLLLTAALTGFYNPYYVWGDIGWYLSFFAFFGVLVLAPLIAARLKLKLPLIGNIALESLSAQIMTLPLILFIFGRISVVGLVANTVIVPMVPFAMFFSMIAGLAGMIVPVISGWLALPARIILDLMIILAEWFAKWPKAQVMATIGPISLVVLYLVIIVFTAALRKHLKNVKIKSKLTN